MANHAIVVRGDVHIPPCKECNDNLKYLIKALKDKGLTCVSKNRRIGLPETWFKEDLKETRLTVIHKCPFLWEKIKDPLLQMSKKGFEKVSIVTFPESENFLGNEAIGNNKEFQNFFLQCSPTDLTDEESLSEFVEDIVQELDEARLKPRRDSITEDEESSLGQNSPNDRSEASNDRSEASNGRSEAESKLDLKMKDDIPGLELEGFQKYPDVFGDLSHPRLHVMKACLNSDSLLEYSNALECSQKAEEISKMSEEEILPHLKHIFHVVLPQFYKKKDMVGLASLTGCNHLAIQNRAAILLEVVIFERQTEDKHADHNELIVVESLLWSAIDNFQLKSKDNSSKSSVDHPTCQRLAGLYGMVLCNFILNSTSPLEFQMCDIHLETIHGRPLPANMSSMKMYFKGRPIKRCEQLKRIVQDKANNNVEETLPQQPCAVQIAVVFSYLRKMFKCLDMKELEFLDGFVTNKKKPDCCTTVVTGGLAYLLLTRHKQPVQQNQLTCFVKAVKILDKLLTLAFSEEAVLCMRDPKLLKAVTKDKALTKVEWLLRPLLTDVRRPEVATLPLKTVDWKSGEKTSNWESATGKFNSKKVLIWILMSDDNSRKKELNPTEDKYCNEMQKLSLLDHENIIKMMAFQDSNRTSPAFYITEDWPYNLQYLLNYKRQTGDYFHQTELVKFLEQTAEAVEYCHGEELVHRNLTAASLLLTSDNSIKLCGFTASQKLVDGQWIANKKINIPIPARWTAPEYLLKREYTKSSDVWMFGHLIYELLTHGLLPYSNTGKLDLLELVKKISEKSTALVPLPCIEVEHFQLISDCTLIPPDERPDISEVKQRLLEFTEAPVSAGRREEAFNYPELSEEYKSSVEGEMEEAPDITLSTCFADQGELTADVQPISLSETFTRFRFIEKNEEIFRDKLVHKIPLQMQRKIEDGVLSDILSEIKIVQNSREAYHIDCKVPGICRDSLLKVTLEKGLGENLQPYIDCLCQVALILKNLSPDWILGDICAKNIYLVNEEMKVYVVSLTYLHLKEYSKEMERPSDTDIISRAAPEVIQSGMFSSASDVYCFGNLLWEVLKAFDFAAEGHDVDEFEANMKPKVESKQKLSEMAVSEKWEATHANPDCCPESLYKLMIECTNQVSTRRLPVEKLVKELHSFYKKTFDCEPTGFKSDEGAN